MESLRDKLKEQARNRCYRKIQPEHGVRPQVDMRADWVIARSSVVIGKIKGRKEDV